MYASTPAQIGGRLLGQGLYGCTFEPVPRCAGGQIFKIVSDNAASTGSVGKITIEDASKELSVGQRIMRMPLAQQYFALPTESCTPALPVNDPDAAKCKILKKDGDDKGNKDDNNKSKPTLLVMPMGGQAIYKWAQRLDRLAANYLRVMKHMLEGIVLYQNEGYVHNDIHMGNVLVDERGVARFIDFGQAYRVDSVREWSDANLGVTFRPKYVWDAPELHCWRALKSGVRISDAVRQIKELNPEWSSLETQFPARPSAEKSMTSFFSEDPSWKARDSGAFVRAWGKGTDSWRMGLFLWFLWSDLIAWRELDRTDLWIRHRDLVRRILGGLTEFDPRRRWNAQRALVELDPKSRIAEMQ